MKRAVVALQIGPEYSLRNSILPICDNITMLSWMNHISRLKPWERSLSPYLRSNSWSLLYSDMPTINAYKWGLIWTMKILVMRGSFSLPCQKVWNPQSIMKLRRYSMSVLGVEKIQLKTLLAPQIHRDRPKTSNHLSLRLLSWIIEQLDILLHVRLHSLELIWFRRDFGVWYESPWKSSPPARKSEITWFRNMDH